MARHIRNFLRAANRILQEEPVIWLEREIPSSKLFHPKFQKHRFATMNSLTEDLHNLYHNPYKIKTFLQVINSRLDYINALQNKYKPYRYIYYPLLGASFILGGYYIYNKITDLEREDNPWNPLNKSTSGLKYVVSRFVLYNDRIINETAKLINQICNKERIQYMTMHALSRLLDMKSIIRSTDKLTKEFIHRDLMNNEEIQEKLKQIIIRQLKDENRRADLLKLLLNFMKSEQARELVVDNGVNILSMPEFRQQQMKNLFGFIYNKLDDQDLKEGMKSKVDTYLNR